MIGDSAFESCKDLMSIKIPESVTTIGKSAFEGCSSLMSVDIPESVTQIDDYAFYNCSSLENITLPDNITTLEWFVFANCSSLKKIVLPIKTTRIDTDAFYGCSALSSVAIPESVTEIAFMAFSGCSSLREIHYYGSRSDWDKIYIGLYNSDLYRATVYYNDYRTVTFKQGNGEDDLVYKVGYGQRVDCPSNPVYEDRYFMGWYDEDDELCLEGEGDGFSVTEDTVLSAKWAKVYGDFTYYENVDDTVTIAKYIGTGTKAEVPKEISENKVAAIGNQAFYECDELESVTLPDGLTSIGDEAFDCCYELRNISIPDSVTRIGEEAFYSCDSLESIEIPSGVKTLEEWVFSSCDALKNITLHEGVVTIKNNAFSFCPMLENVKLPNSVKTIEYSAFYGCSSLKSVYISDGVEEIEGEAFRDCPSLSEIKVGSHNAVFDSRNNCNAVIDSAEDKLIFGCKNTVIPNDVRAIEKFAFCNCTNLTKLELPDSVEEIGESAFYGCAQLNKISIPDKVTKLEKYVFASSGIKQIVIPKSISSIEMFCFDKCESLEDVYYKGSESDWEWITIDVGNYSLKNASIHYDYAEKEPENPEKPDTESDKDIDVYVLTAGQKKVNVTKYLDISSASGQINYYTSDKKVISINKKGLMTCKKNAHGLVEIGALDANTHQLIDKCKIKVERPIVQKKVEAAPGTTVSLNKIITNSSRLKRKPDSVVSAKPSVVQVTEDGDLKVVGDNGAARITLLYGNAKYKFKIKIVR